MSRITDGLVVLGHEDVRDRADVGARHAHVGAFGDAGRVHELGAHLVASPLAPAPTDEIDDHDRSRADHAERGQATGAQRQLRRFLSSRGLAQLHSITAPEA